MAIDVTEPIFFGFVHHKTSKKTLFCGSLFQKQDGMTTSGYSKTPLSKKLGIQEGFHIQVYNTPKKYTDFFYEFPQDVVFHTSENQESIDFIHIFATTENELNNAFLTAKPLLKKNGVLWLSWPKKSSQMASELDQSFVRNFGLKNGLVDVKVAAIDENWSGHKFVYRVKDR